MFDFSLDGFGNDQEYSKPQGPMVPDKMDCMRCGACLSQCPTYALTQDEEEGPRQRIRTLSDLVIENKTVEENAIEHLNNCIQCRACEAICPSQMDYSLLFDQAQQKLAENHQPTVFAKLALKLVEQKSQFKKVLPLINLYHISGVRWLARNTGLLKILGLYTADSLAQKPALKSLQADYPAPLTSKGKVALFTGCISEHFDRETIEAAIKVLTRMGYEVTIPEQQGCCGAIHYHNGEQETARKLMIQNRSCFNALDVEAVIYCASGCGSQLSEYATVLELDEESAFVPPLYEVMAFIHQHWNDALQLKPYFKQVAVHEPCSHRNVLKNQQSIYDVLGKIQGLKTTPLTDNHLCCGAGGSYMLTHPETANSLRDIKLSHILKMDANLVVSTNIGCAMHLNAAKSGQKVVHPVSLVAALLA